MTALDWRSWTLDWRSFGSGLAYGALPVVQGLIVSFVAFTVLALLELLPANEDLAVDLFLLGTFGVIFVLFAWQLAERARQRPEGYPAFAFGIYAINELAYLPWIWLDLDRFFPPGTTTSLSEVVVDVAWRPVLIGMMVVIHRLELERGA